MEQKIMFQELKNLQLKEWFTIFFSGSVVLFTFLQWKIKQRELGMNELRTACRNFFNICLSDWLRQLEIIISLNGSYSKQIWFSLEENKFSLKANKHTCPDLLKEMPPELEKHTPRKLKNEFVKLNKKVIEFNIHLEQLHERISDLANRCLEEINRDVTVITYIEARKLERWVMVEFFLDSLFAGYEIAKKERKNRGTIDTNYLYFFFSEEAEKFIEKMENKETDLIFQHQNLIKEAKRLEILLREKRQILSVKYYIPIKELQ